MNFRNYLCLYPKKMPDNCPDDLYSSVQLVVRHVFRILETIPENMLDNIQASFLGLSGTFFWDCQASFLGS